MIIQVTTKKQLNQFIYYVKILYCDCKIYTYPIFRSLKKELTTLVLNKKTYKALLSIDEHGKVNGRILYTFAVEKRKNERICYFSFFDTQNDMQIVNELFAYIEMDMKKENIIYLEGPYAPYDPDTRRGVLIEGYELEPTIFHSYNYSYYNELLTKAGFIKKQDTFALNAKMDNSTLTKLKRFAEIFNSNYNVEIRSVNFKKIEQDIEDVTLILKKATDDQNYQDAPTKELIRTVFKSLKFFLMKDYIKIARDKVTHQPIGFCLVMLDYNKVFHQTKGRIHLFKFVGAKRKIKKAIGKLQYVVPEYQRTGLIATIFYEILNEMQKNHITEFEAGTILENNERSYRIFFHLGGQIVKRFRIYHRCFR